ncbi:hypothetical protein [Acidisarcina polymorpha]
MNHTQYPSVPPRLVYAVTDVGMTLRGALIPPSLLGGGN